MNVSYDIEELKTDLMDQMTRALNLNNEFAVETSFLVEEKLSSMVSNSFSANIIEPAAALLITFDQNGDYDSERFRWFQAHYDSFVYVDRIVVSGNHQKKGLARKLYEHLFTAAKAGGHNQVMCEVNFNPPNPVSDAFHSALGFEEIAKSEPNDAGKIVTYMRKIIYN